jgi:hypothetical protein
MNNKNNLQKAGENLTLPTDLSGNENKPKLAISAKSKHPWRRYGVPLSKKVITTC